MFGGRGNIMLAAVLAAGFTAVFFLSNFVSANRVSMPESYADSALAVQGKRLKGFSLGSEGLLADWYWMWSLQYIGGKIVKAEGEEINLDDLRSLNPKLLYPLLDNAAELDPKFMAIFSYGASVLPAIDAHQAIALTEKGIEHNPDAWRLYQYLGYIYWRMKDYEKAAETYERGSRVPGAPGFMRQMVAAMKTQGGSRDTAYQLYSQMLAEAEDHQSRVNAELRLREIESLDEREAVNRALAENRERNGRCVTRTSEILPAIRNLKLPRGTGFRIDQRGELTDPLGTPYLLDPESCTISLGIDSRIPKPL